MKKEKVTYYIVILFAVLIVTFCIGLVVYTYLNMHPQDISPATVFEKGNGGLGDVVNGITAPIIMTCMAILTFLAFFVQYQANEQQRDYIKKQRFEDTFFNLLDNHQRIVDAMDLVSYKSEKTTVVSKEVDATTKKPMARVVASKRDCFKKMYKRIKKLQVKENRTDSIEDVNRSYTTVQDIYKGDLHHYYRFLYRILKFVKDSDIEESQKYEYTSVLRAVLSPYELAMLFYNGLHPFGAKMKPLMEEFSFLKNIDRSLLLNPSHKSQYHDVAIPDDSEDRFELLADWKKLQQSKENPSALRLWFRDKFSCKKK